jgi:hypothetical protein
MHAQLVARQMMVNHWLTDFLLAENAALVFILGDAK